MNALDRGARGGRACAGGLDVGSVSVKLVVCDGDGVALLQRYERHRGQPGRVALVILREAAQRFPGLPLLATGTAGRRIADAMGVSHITELTAHALGMARLHPEVRSIIEMGGEDSKLILLEDGRVADFALNSVCAAGTGAFLDQQAERMRLSIEDFGRLGLACARPPHIAGRCSVFAKSDMIHLQQIACPVQDIVGGLCMAVARNFRGAIARGRTLCPPVAFIGGVALNPAMRRAFAEVFSLSELMVPDPPTTVGALGAALAVLRDGAGVPLTDAACEALERSLDAADAGADRRGPLREEGGDFDLRHPCAVSDEGTAPAATERIPAYMGIDVGSISTNLAVIDVEGRLLARRYLRTASRPIEAVRTGLREIGEELGGRADILGVGTTGSGRYMIADFTGADVVRNEITAQARAAAFIDPQVDTIFEIGGQDSKYIRIDDGVITGFEMNRACAAGTGSFLEEQAERLDVSVIGEFEDRALEAPAPCRLGERCTVFMENSLMAGLSRGAQVDDLLAGLAYSIVENYLGRVVGSGRVGHNVFFQGGTASNRAVVAAFERHLGRRVTVPPNHDVTGAIGMALIARDHMRAAGTASAFRGFDLALRGYEQESFTCKGCDNRCEINAVRIEGVDDKMYYGGRCEKYDMRRPTLPEGEDLFRMRERALREEHDHRAAAHVRRGVAARRGRIGLPYAFFMHDQLPYWSTLLWELGFEPVLSPRTGAGVVRLGSEAVLADVCHPLRAAIGHALHLALPVERGGEGCETLFIPSFVNMNAPDDAQGDGLACPLTQSYPFQVRQAAPTCTVVVPAIQWRHGRDAVLRALRRAFTPWRVSLLELGRAESIASEAQDAFEARLRQRGREVLDALDGRALVVVGRPYNAFDPGMNLGLPDRIAALGVRAIPMDFLPLEPLPERWRGMYWRSGQRMLAATRAIRRDSRLYPVYMGSFSCGPDTFIHKLVERELGGTPALFLEVDEHGADAGLVTRVEAFLDSIDARRATRREERASSLSRRAPAAFTGRGRTLLLPRMSDGAYGLESAFRACGAEARVLPETTPEAVAMARAQSSGKECYPFTVTLGDMLSACAAPEFRSDRAAFFMPGGTGPCRFGQYGPAQRMVLDDLGYGDVPVYSPEQSVRLYDDMGIVGRDLARRAWRAIVAFDLLAKCRNEVGPHAFDSAQVAACHAESMERLRRALLGSADDVDRALARIRDDFRSLRNGPQPGVPRIGIVGEIFVRSNEFCNERLCRSVEALGGEAWLAPIGEWIAYVNAMSLRDAARLRRPGRYLALRLTRMVQTAIHHRCESVFDGMLRTTGEPATSATLRAAAPYLGDCLRGEAVLSVGTAVHMIRSGCHGIINAMPFGCMPGTVVTALMRGVTRHHGVPCISLPFDGTRSSSNRLQLEAFMDQARQRAMAQGEGEARA
ncbi:putative CoA-substrate-specific enzyme activase [Desulfobaculum xiamenense]|uniref:Putative CoA-substrate-specific enzyme activase n=1 Tax=Desulfobaculum xiamenense TaxID=995050 RepID=A0A846QPQ1_9BACT|nr:acyl-CoA dehydratase activase [Desulfobaculum xiamenense]NJB69157.1 putative CoA-substrate-specific enzyme activase [Desulfobaculum xiamenense]